MIGQRLFHFGSLPPDAPRPVLWISLGYHYERPGQPNETSCPYLNVTLCGRFVGRVYQRNLYRRKA